jgi:predicted alpha/beta hydrolase family esterase
MIRETVKAVIEETAVLVALGLFVATIALWAMIIAEKAAG